MHLINIHDSIHFNYEGKWIAHVQKRNRKGELVTLFKETYSTGWAAVVGVKAFCKANIAIKTFEESEWFRYYNECDRHIAHMMAKKGTVSESEWQMSFSCDAPNKPGYEYANNH